MSKFLSFARDSVWTWGGGIIVLVTLSGSTQMIGLWITIIAFMVQLLGFVFGDDE